MPDDANEYFAREYIEPGIFRPDDIAAGCHCMTPRYLADQLDRSRRNLGVECVDVFYLHNPETQLERSSAGGISRGAFARRSRFWNRRSLREKSARTDWPHGTLSATNPKSQGYLSLAAMEEIARGSRRRAITISVSCSCR